MGKLRNVRCLLLFIGALAIFPLGCRAQPPPVKYSLPELKYLLLESFDEVFWCDPDLYPVARVGQEEKNALEQFPTIQANTAEFSAILQHLALSNRASYNDEEKLLIYQEHKKLTYQVEMTPSGDIYQFVLRVGEGQGERIEGTITLSGDMKVLKREPSFNTCPICLVKGTLIDTPGLPVPVEQMREGMAVWTINEAGNRIEGIVLKTVATTASSSFRVVKVTLSDGRAVTASSGHPTATGQALGDYRVGDTLDGAAVIAVEHIDYDGFTYDLLPSGGTGLYWANDVLLKSTIVTK